MAQGRKTFVLVHGAWHGGWCYARVARLLRAHGHDVYTPTLTGLGERSHLAHLPINCSTHVQDVVNLIEWERLENVVLCGHSYGGLVIGGVADRMPERIASLVCLDAVIPQDNQSVIDLMQVADIAPLLRSSSAHGGLLVPPAPASLFNVNAADRAMVDALCTPQPIATFTERVRLTGAYLRVPAKSYILARGWENPAVRLFHSKIKDDPAWTLFEVFCGHDVMLDEPQRLAEILLTR